MATYVGFTTQSNESNQIIRTSGLSVEQVKAGNKFRMTDESLVIRDLLNALSIRQGEKAGMPSYGTTIWSHLYEPNDSQTRSAIETELRRVIGEDPRIELNTVSIWPQENGILFEVEIMINQFNQPMNVRVDLNATNGRATLA
jgi:phage baseplate assembly protein W